MSYNLHNNHPLINRQQKFLLNRKVVTIHSEDRDFNKYPNSNEFSIDLPQSLKNVQSMRLLDTVFPADLYTFTNSYQNTKFKVGINLSNTYSGPNNPVTINDTTFYFEELHTITITEGNYSYEQLCFELENSLNNIANVSGFSVRYSEAEQKFYFVNTNNFLFAFFFDEELDYSNCKSFNLFNKHNRWGLGWNLGFNKKTYIPNIHSDTSTNGYISSESKNTPLFDAPTDSNQPVYWLKSERCSNIKSSEVIYMEIEKYNSVDEIVPNVENTSANYYSSNNCVENCNTTCVNGVVNNKVSKTNSSDYTKSLKNINSCLNKSNQNDYGGRINSVFAKIYTRGFNLEVVNETITDAESGGHRYITTFDNQLEERINKLIFKFRFHDGTPVDFCGKDFNFSIEFNQIASDMLNDLQVREVYTNYA